MTSSMVHSAERARPQECERIALEATQVCHSEQISAPPVRVLIVPWGEVRSASGDFVVDADGAAQAIAAFSAHGADLPVDYEHQTLGGTYASPNGQAPAAGWITGLRVVTPSGDRAPGASAINSALSDETDSHSLSVNDDGSGTSRPAPGIWADVSWTDDAKQHLAARRYRYLSPVALVRKADRKLIGVHSVALTNKPAIVGMTPVVNRSATIEAESLDLAPLKSVLRLDDSASATAIVAGAVSRVRELERRETEREAARRVEEACRSGKLAAPQRDWAFALALKDAAEFDRWLASAPVVVPLGRSTAPGPGSASHAGFQRSAASSAKAEWQANRAFLERLCTEEAYVATALRDVN
ncbi:MAG: hypothetical protein H6819_10540 [Phycisphaerales bacterium]|nr:hypothetical protein [Phycisphaerales bacterium]MCB9855934.1 hypothetical protein [Phycisphaerales bacterium]MCB9864085.1 hypothetical protein [Phycisphaerales bacterium]